MKELQRSLEYHALKIFAACVQFLPLNAARFIARRLADLVFYVIPIRRKVVIANLTAAFAKEKSPADIRRIAHGVYRQFAQTMVELILFPKLAPDDIERLVTIENRTILDLARKMGKGAVLVGAHFGNWELMAAALALTYPMTLVVGQQENTRVDDLLNSYRIQKGENIVPLKLALRGVLKALKSNGFVAILADQDAHEDGAFVEFFGRPASTPRGPAMFALRAGCPLIMGTIIREKGKFRIVFETVPRPEPSGENDKDIVAYTAAFTRILESHVRENPEHWFWMHRRWKTKNHLANSISGQRT